MSTNELEEIKARLDRQEKIRIFEREQVKELIAWGKKPWFIKEQQDGDYHYCDFDMDPEEAL